jgi:hypothetical protein
MVDLTAACDDTVKTLIFTYFKSFDAILPAKHKQREEMNIPFWTLHSKFDHRWSRLPRDLYNCNAGLGWLQFREAEPANLPACGALWTHCENACI